MFISMALADFIIKARWWVLAAMLAVIGVSAWGLQYARFDSDTRVFFGPDNPDRRAMEAMENIYTPSYYDVIALAPRDGNVFSRRALQALEELTKAAWQLPYATRVDSLANFQHMRARGDELSIADLIQDAARYTDAQLQEIKNIALGEPSLRNALVSDRGHVAAVTVLTVKPGKSPEESAEIAKAIQALAADIERRYPDIDVYVSGRVSWDYAFAKVGEDDMRTLVPIMFIVMALVVVMALRSFAASLVTLFVIIAAGLTAMGIGGWMGLIINPVSANAPVVILTLAIADSVHILSTWLHKRQSGMANEEALRASLSTNLMPVVVTSVTTAIGFLAMNLSDAPPFHDFGNLVAIGVMAALLYSIFFVPAAMLILPTRASARSLPVHGCMVALADWTVSRRRVLTITIGMAMVFLAMGIPRIQLNDEFSRYVDERYEVTRHYRFLDRNLSGYNQLEFSIESGEDNGVAAPEYLRYLEKFEAWARQQDGVVHVNSLVHVVKRLNQAMHGDDPAYYKIPDDRAAIAQYLLLYEMSLPYGLDLNSQLNVSKSASRFLISMHDTSSVHMRSMAERANRWLDENLPPHVSTMFTGEMYLWARISERNIITMLGATILALLMISVLLTLLFRSLKLGLVSLVTNLSPAMMTFGLWGWLVGEVGLAASVITAMTFGIVVDDTIHFLTSYLRARRSQGMSAPNSVRHAFATVGSAMIVTSVVLAAGFLVLLSSGFKINADTGALTAITIGFALLADLLFLPGVLCYIDGQDQPEDMTGRVGAQGVE